MIISGERVNIRAIEYEDLDFLKDIMNSPELEKMENGFYFPVSRGRQEQWYQEYLRSQSDNRFIIETKEGRQIGYTCLLNIDWKNRKAHTGIKLYGMENYGKGFGTDSVLSIMKFAFYEMQLNRLEGFIIDYNHASKKLYLDKCGWKIEGVQREAVFKNGQYHDLIMVASLKSEFIETNTVNTEESIF